MMPKGFKHSEESKQKIRKSLIGRIRGGYKHPDLPWRNSKQYGSDYQRFVKYGIRPEEYSKLVDEQDGVCAICKRPEVGIDKRSGFPHRLRVDHDHETNQVRGLLCINCNRALERLDNIPNWCELAILYLNKAKNNGSKKAE